MFVHIANFHPAPGKTGELRAILEEQVRDRQARGYQAALESTAYGPGNPALHILIVHENLSALQNMRDELRESTTEYGRRSASFLRTTVEVELWEGVVPTNRGATPVNFRLRNVATAALDKIADYRALLTERAAAEQGQGLRVGVLTQYVGPAGGTFVVTRPYESLAELEEGRARVVADAVYVAKVGTLITGSVSSSIREVLVPASS